MNINLRKVINSRYGLGLALGVGRWLPPGLGYPLADILSKRIAARRSSEMVRAVRANQWVVQGETLSAKQLDQAVRETFRCVARCQFDLYHNLHNHSEVMKRVKLTDEVAEIFERTRSNERAGKGEKGLVLVGVHMSGFDLILQSATQLGMRAQALSIDLPGEGYRMQMKLRREHGLEVTIGSVATLKQALSRLEAGGSIVTGIDFPMLGVKRKPRFFGRPACLPLHHILIALKAKVPVYVLMVISGSDGLYYVQVSKPIPMQSRKDHTAELVYNGERVLEVAESFIRQAPHQWSMFYPVWPDALNQMP